MLVYLSNAVEKHCREIGFRWNGPWYKWASYGFSSNGILQLEEYYPNATLDTYRGVSGWLYQVAQTGDAKPMLDIPFAYTSSHPLAVTACEYVPDACEALLKAEQYGKIVIRRYHELTAGQLRWLEQIIPQEYAKAENHPEYRHFLQDKFPSLIPG